MHEIRDNLLNASTCTCIPYNACTRKRTLVKLKKQLRFIQIITCKYIIFLVFLKRKYWEFKLCLLAQYSVGINTSECVYVYAVQYQFINHQLCALLSIYFKHLTLTYRATVHQCLPIIIRLKRNAQSQYILEVCFLCITSKVTKPVKLWASKEGSLFLSFSPPLLHSFLNSLLRSAKYLVKNIFFCVHTKIKPAWYRATMYNCVCYMQHILLIVSLSAPIFLL